MTNKNSVLFSYILLLLATTSCDESLPPYEKPENLLTIDRIEIIQGSYSLSGNYQVQFFIFGKNQFDEPFSDTVEINGTVAIWCKSRPDLFATLRLNNSNFGPNTNLFGSILTLDPGEEFEFRATWDSVTDEEEYFPDLFNLSRRMTVASPDEREFYVQVEITLFQEIGLLKSDPVLFIYNG